MKQLKIILPLLVLFLSLLLSCSPRASHTLLNFFFDGVPVSEANTVKDAVRNDIALSLQTDMAVRDKEQPGNDYYLHQPYKTRQCVACHESQNLGKLVVVETKLCTYCHESFTAAYDKVHGPVESGHCMLCHNPHMSKNKNMLVRNANDICTYCHDFTELSPSSHLSDDSGECTGCHNPHGGGKNYLY